MLNSTKAIAAWAALCLSVLAAQPGGCSAVTDNQSDDGSKVLSLSGNRNIVFTTKTAALYGTYKVHGTTPLQNANCRWRVFLSVKGHWVQSSPRKVGSWNHLSDLLHRGSVTINKPLLFESRDCPNWESRQ